MQGMNRFSRGLKGVLVIVLRKATALQSVCMEEPGELQAPNGRGGWPSDHFHPFSSLLTSAIVSSRTSLGGS